jgi:hypothetical protein
MKENDHRQKGRWPRYWHSRCHLENLYLRGASEVLWASPGSFSFLGKNR